MAKQRLVNTHFWDDTFIVRLSSNEKLLFLYFITNPLTNIAGAYEISLRRIAFDTGIEADEILTNLEKFESADKMIFRDGWILILNFIKNQSFNPKIIKGIEDAVKCCPDWIKDRLSISYESLSHLNTNTNINTNTNPTRDRVSIPKIELVGKPVNNSSEDELERWLDEVAKIFGVPNRFALADFDKWENVCRKAIDGGVPLDRLIETTESEINRLTDTPQFFSPNSVLKQIQMATAKPTPQAFVNPMTGQGLK